METTPRRRLRRKDRIVSGAAFRRIYAHGSRVRGELLMVVACANGLEHPRLGLSVGKRIWKSAVRRNRVRRVFREAFRLARDRLPAGFDLVLIPAVPRLEARLEPVMAELVRLAPRAAEKARRKAASAGERAGTGRPAPE